MKNSAPSNPYIIFHRQPYNSLQDLLYRSLHNQLSIFSENWSEFPDLTVNILDSSQIEDELRLDYLQSPCFLLLPFFLLTWQIETILTSSPSPSIQGKSFNKVPSPGSIDMKPSSSFTAVSIHGSLDLSSDTMLKFGHGDHSLNGSSNEEEWWCERGKQGLSCFH